MLIPYLGEKSKFASFILPNIPKDISTYVEPFGGMFGIFFALDFMKYKDVDFIYNDQNKLNHLLFNKLRDEDFIDFVKETKVDEDLYKSCFKYLVSEGDENLLALYWLIILCCSSPYEIDKPSWRGPSEFEIFKMKYSAYKYHLDKINHIHNLDYKDIVKKYDSKDTFFYIDPPYFGKEKFYINHTFTQESHKELADVLNNIQGRFLLSYYEFDQMKDFYPNCQIKSLMTIMGTEFLIMNY